MSNGRYSLKTYDIISFSGSQTESSGLVDEQVDTYKQENLKLCL